MRFRLERAVHAQGVLSLWLAGFPLPPFTSDRQVRSLKIVNVYNVVDALAAMSSNLLSLGILQLFGRLDCEILSFNSFLEFFSLTMLDRRFFETVRHLLGIVWPLACNCSASVVEPVLEFVAQVEVTSLLVDFMGVPGHDIRSLGLEVVSIVCFASVRILLLLCALLSSEPKTDCHYSIWIGGVTSS